MSIPDGLDSFLAGAGWSDGVIEPLAGDASFRRYFRVRRDDGRSAMAMHAPAPNEDPRPFLHVGRWLLAHGLRAPHILAAQAGNGFVLLEDFGDERLRDRLDREPGDEDALYAHAIDALAQLHRCPAGPFDPYDMTVYRREVALLPEWYAKRAGLAVDEPAYHAAWDEALQPLIARQSPGVTVLRDYHAENIMLLPGASQGLIDFQDALVGHPAYDLVSLLQDARRDVSPDLERRMIEHYRSLVITDEHFESDYARLGAQRNAKIVGIFTRLAERDGKPRYLDLIPRVWALMERDLAHPALAAVAHWFEGNIPSEIREANGALAQ